MRTSSTDWKLAAVSSSPVFTVNRVPALRVNSSLPWETPFSNPSIFRVWLKLEPVLTSSEVRSKSVPSGDRMIQVKTPVLIGSLLVRESLKS